MMKTKREFDCLALKDRVQTQIYEEIKNLTEQERIEYFHKESERGKIGDWWKDVKLMKHRN